MRRRLVVSYVSIAAVILLALELPLWLVYARHEHDVAGVGVVHDATALASLAEEGVEHRDTLDLIAVADHYRTAVTGDVEIIERDGSVVVAPRGGDPSLVSPNVRAELTAVVHGGPAGIHQVPHSDALVAFEPIGSADSPSGAVAVAVSDEAVDGRLHSALLALAGLSALVLAAVALLGLVVARSVTGPLTHLQAAAQRLGDGDLTARAPDRKGPAEVRSLSREFNGMAGRLEELVAAQKGFVAEASHQLRSPLTALRLRLENATAGFPDADSDAVLAELDRLSRVVDGLLTLARAEGQRPERAPVDVAGVAADRVDAWSALAEEAGIRLTADLPPAGTMLARLVPGHLEQIFDNLLANAVEATAAGKAVELSVREVGGSVEAHVIDEGHGMGEEERRHAFDRFWRGSGGRPDGGSGLGLAIVRQLAGASGAEVELRHAPSGGIDGVIRMRRARSAQPRTAQPRPAQPRPAQPGTAQPRTAQPPTTQPREPAEAPGP